MIEQFDGWFVSLSEKADYEINQGDISDFQKLPKGLKQLLVVSESFFFDEMKTAAPVVTEIPQPAVALSLGSQSFGMGSLLHPSWKKFNERL